MKGRTDQHTAQKRWEINIMKATSNFSPLLTFSVFPFSCCYARRLHGGWKAAGMKVRRGDISLTLRRKSLFRK